MGISSYHACYHCKDRTIGCHAKCETYQAEKKEAERIKENRASGTRRIGASSIAKCNNHVSLRNRCHKR